MRLVIVHDAQGVIHTIGRALPGAPAGLTASPVPAPGYTTTEIEAVGELANQDLRDIYAQYRLNPTTGTLQQI